MEVSQIKEMLLEVMLEKAGCSFISNINLLEAHTWTFSTVRTAKAYNYNNREISIIAKFPDYETYETLINKAFYAIIDSNFTDRIDTFNNRTLELTINFKVKS